MVWPCRRQIKTKSMRLSHFFLTSSTIALLSSCGGQQQTQQTDEITTQVCRYTYNNDSTSVKWTAYKFTDKVGVSGVFDSIEVNGTAEQMTVMEVFAGTSFRIPVSSINSLVPDRDQKIQKHFFGTMTGTSTIEGKMIGHSEDTAHLEISMNGQTVPVDFIINYTGNEIKLEGVIQLGDWGAQPSVEALNKICHDLHIGADGISMLWPEVKLEIRTVLTEKCD